MDRDTKIIYAGVMPTDTEQTPVARLASTVLGRWGGEIPDNSPASAFEVLAWKMAALEIPLQVEEIEIVQESMISKWKAGGPMPRFEDVVNIEEFTANVMLFMSTWAVRLGAPSEKTTMDSSSA